MRNCFKVLNRQSYYPQHIIRDRISLDKVAWSPETALGSWTTAAIIGLLFIFFCSQ